MKKILITGSNGLLGQKLIYALLKRNQENTIWDILATSRGENRMRTQAGYAYQPLDLTDALAVNACIETFRPDVVIHTAAMTNVDACELDPAACQLQNVTVVAHQLKALEKLKTTTYNPHFIHLSTDFVFDGENGPYRETDLPNPLSHYAQSKLDSEKLVLASSLRTAIARTIIVYGIVDGMSRSNLILWAKGALEKGQQINVVDDQFRAPTLAEDLAEGCLLIAEKNATGIFHLSGKETASILDWVYQVADFWKLDKSLITPAKSETIKQPARRPPRTGFIIDKAMHELGYAPHSFSEGLALLDRQLKQNS